MRRHIYEEMFNREFDRLSRLTPASLLEDLQETFHKTDLEEAFETIAMRYEVAPIATDVNDEDYALGLASVLRTEALAPEDLQNICFDLATWAAEYLAEAAWDNKL